MSDSAKHDMSPGALLTCHPSIREAVRAIAIHHQSDFAQKFYVHMLGDPQAACFLSVESVKNRLSPGMARWIGALFSIDSTDDLTVILAQQRHIGEIHARNSVPVSLVARGFRLLKKELANKILTSAMRPVDVPDALIYATQLLDMAFEEMSAAYIHAQESDIRTEEAFRLASIGQNLGVEKARQLGALLEWDNQLLRSVAIESTGFHPKTLGESPFALWLGHKAPFMFSGSRELTTIAEIIRRVDNHHLPQFHAKRVTPALVLQLTKETEEIRYLLSELFDRAASMEIGKDPLTQVFNRRFMPTILKRELELARKEGKTFSVLMVDIDHFKTINDQYSHDSGDRALQAVAVLLLGSVRISDFVIRWGGEEFLIILAETNTEQAYAIAEKIRQRVADTPIVLSGERTISITISIGVCQHNGHPDYQHLLNRADAALYDAKRTGRNQTAIAS